MDTLVCVKPGHLQLMQRPLPPRGAGEVLLKPVRIGICGTDYHIYEGNQPFLSYPRVMGHELAVEVVEALPESGFVTGQICVVNPYLSCGRCIACRQGKPNCCVNIAVLGVHRDGGMTGLLSLPAQNLIATEGLSADECAMVEFLAIGAHAVRRGVVGPNDRALVIGAGPIGLGVGLFASLSGAAVTMMDREARRLDVASTLFPCTTGILAGEGAASAISEGTQGEGFDIVFDATGSRQSIEDAFSYVANGGRYVLVSVVKGQIAFTDADFHRKEISLMGSRNATMEDFARVLASMAEGHVPAARWITHRTTLRDAVEDLPRWATDRAGLIKAVIDIA
ncbi:MAG: zinc-binding alcohol dehydrogenase family protein [Sphingomonadales bacterium]|nr:MAG: zinc-binding alcohol dehydrogenase family protein [Sphingomonadales bacterium]